MEEKAQEQTKIDEGVVRRDIRAAIDAWAAEHRDHREWARDFFLKRLGSSCDSFNFQLISLIDKADAYNRQRLSRGFPCATDLWMIWYFSGSEKTFLQELEKVWLKGGEN